MERVGEHAAAEWKSVHIIPSSASLSRFGVRISPPKAPTSEKPRSSATMMRKLGLFVMTDDQSFEKGCQRQQRCSRTSLKGFIYVGLGTTRRLSLGKRRHPNQYGVSLERGVLASLPQIRTWDPLACPKYDAMFPSFMIKHVRYLGTIQSGWVLALPPQAPVQEPILKIGDERTSQTN
jgi:hypothetical protein